MMLVLRDLGQSAPVSLDVFDDLVPISIQFDIPDPAPNFYLRFGDGERSLIEVHLTLDGRILSVTVVLMLASCVSFCGQPSKTLPCSLGFPRFDHGDLYREGDDWSERFVDAFSKDARLVVRQNSCELMLRQRDLISLIDNPPIRFGLSKGNQLASIMIELSPQQVQALENRFK